LAVFGYNALPMFVGMALVLGLLAHLATQVLRRA